MTTKRDKTEYESGIHCTSDKCKGELTYLLRSESIAGCPVCGTIYDLKVEDGDEGVEEVKEYD